MISDSQQKVDSADAPGGLLVLAVLSLVAGGVTGLVGGAFRLALLQADAIRNALIAWANGESLLGLLAVMAACAAATTLAAWLVRHISPHASGSGIPHVEAVLQGVLRPAPIALIPVKFVGGVLAIGAGLALGREGPTVQLGASLSHLVGRLFRRNWSDCRTLLAAGAGAGLATAFNAPIGGAVFVLEELVRRFETRIAVAALGASAAAIAVARVLLGRTPEFHVEPLNYPGSEVCIIFLALGVIAGFAAIAYNRTLLAATAANTVIDRWPAELRALVVGTAVGALAWYLPELVGGGETLTQLTLDGVFSLAALPLVFLVRFALGPISYAARTPGGLFAPILVLGALLGLMAGSAFQLIAPDVGLPPTVFAVVGMAAFFTGVVRAPVTGIILITEMTGSFQLLLPMLCACFAAMLVPTLLRDPPIYDSLREGGEPKLDSSGPIAVSP